MSDPKHIGDLKPDPNNVRRHTPRNVGLIATALREVGAARSIVIDEQGTILAGNATVEAAAEAGIERVQVVDADGETIIAVRRRGLTPEQKIRLALYDNRASDLSEFDPLLLARLADQGVPVEGLWTDEEWQELLHRAGTELLEEQPPLEDPGAQVDKASQLCQKWQTARGQLWEIPSSTVPTRCHRLMCGDSTSAEDVAKLVAGDKVSLVVTDPPYGVEYAEKNRFLNAIAPGNRIQEPICGDHGNKNEIQALWCGAFSQMVGIMYPGAVVYCFMPQGGDQMMMMMMMAEAGIEPRHELIWLKNNHVLGRADYAYRHEPILYAWKDGAHKFYGGFQTSVLEFPKPQVSDLHPTMKPVELVAKLIVNSSQVGECVYDPFLGSGTTMVAAEQTGRVCYGMEIEPKYCAVALERLAQMGLQPHLVE